MKSLKPIFTYLIWTLVSLILGFTYMRILLGENNFSKDNLLGYLFNVFYHWGIVYVGGIIGLITTFLFIILDLFYLKNKLTNQSSPILIRFCVLLIVFLVVVLIHYFLEKVIDVI